MVFLTDLSRRIPGDLLLHAGHQTGRQYAGVVRGVDPGVDLGPGDGHHPVLHQETAGSLVVVLHPLDGGPRVAASLLLATPVVVDTPVLTLLVLVVLK